MQLPKAKYRIAEKTVHVRFRSNPKRDGRTYAYNINPNTLTADFEVWICGDAERYYLLPIARIREIYADPDAYTDYRHPEIRVLDVDTTTHRIMYGHGGKTADGTGYYRRTLKDLT